MPKWSSWRDCVIIIQIRIALVYVTQNERDVAGQSRDVMQSTCTPAAARQTRAELTSFVIKTTDAVRCETNWKLIYRLGGATSVLASSPLGGASSCSPLADDWDNSQPIWRETASVVALYRSPRRDPRFLRPTSPVRPPGGIHSTETAYRLAQLTQVTERYDYSLVNISLLDMPFFSDVVFLRT